MDYRAIHDKLTKAYYVDKTLSKDEFEKLHMTCNALNMKEAIESGKLYRYNWTGGNPDERTRDLLAVVNNQIERHGLTKTSLVAWEPKIGVDT